MIEAIEKNLYKGIHLLETITEAQYKDNSVQPYGASIGTHIRHIMDMFDCIFEGANCGEIDLTARKRNREAEEVKNAGTDYIHKTIEQLSSFSKEDWSKLVYVTDNLGFGNIRAEYTLSAIFIQAHSHAIHHYASIGYIIHQLGIELPDDSFGFNPTTPKKSIQVS